MEHCSHCGESCKDETIYHEELPFCCNGCKTVYELLHENDLSYYYELEKTPGVSPREFEHKFDFLDNDTIAEKLLEFKDGHISVVSFLIPSIHCSSCIWVLENLNKLQPAVQVSQVNFPEKTIRITFNSERLSLKNLVKLLGRIGYEPYISLEDSNKKKRNIDRSLIYKLGVAGFAFGNVMFLSFPEYFEVNEFWLDRFKPMFRWLMFSFSVPVVFYSAQDYFISAFKGLRSKILNIDVPIALGILVLFVRSTMDISLDWGTGFFDSLTGLVFFLLIGKFFQQKTYSYLSFERDYKSYFPIAVTRLTKSSSEVTIEEQVEVYDIKQGDRILVRNNELLPVDAILIRGKALIDYSFVTGESKLVSRNSGDRLFAGGKQQAGVLEVEVLKPVEQSYLTQLWSNEVFDGNRQSAFQSFTDSISKRFTFAILTIAFVATLYWLLTDPTKAFNVFTAVLIVACPCAIALSAPFTLGNLLRIFGRMKFYVKEASVIEKMAAIDTVVFDKTGTLTSGNASSMTYEGIALTKEEEELFTSTLRASNHPLSRSLYEMLDSQNIKTLDAFEERVGKGMMASADNQVIKIGSYHFVSDANEMEDQPLESIDKTAVHISSNNLYKGCYVFQNEYRESLNEVMKELSSDKELIVLSGDNDGERERLSRLIPEGTRMYFDQKPEDKLKFIKTLQDQGKKVMMVGDGLNDAGALKQSEIGVAVAENVNVFSPACDGILDASMFGSLVDFFQLSRSGIRIIKWSFVLSLIYNVIGLGFAVTGHLAPVVAAILMPLSSISIVVFTTITTRFYGEQFLKK
jgi:Cu+-exporting ATPase